jgi:hypothetical protein
MRKILPALLCLSFLAACDPKYNWREIHGKDAPFTVLLPSKPVSLVRPVHLGEQQVTMTMTAAEVDHVSFAVGSVEMADAEQAHAAVKLMQTALVNNINGKSKALPGTGDAVDIEATGTPTGGQAVLLIAHFTVNGKRAYQVIVEGPKREVVREEAATFISSFKPQ